MRKTASMQSIPTSEVTSTGFRPRRSDTEPQNPVVKALSSPIESERVVACR